MSDKQEPADDKGQSQGGFASGDIVAGKYKVLRVLGKGGYGTVYLVEIVSGMVGQQLALKLVSRGVSGDEKVQRRFINEIRVAMRLVNKYIIQIRDVGTTDTGLLYYTMDFSPGVTLSQIIKSEGAIGIARSCLIALRILRGLFTAHDQGVIHRDLKPANIMVESVDGKETIKILDFGIATAVQDQPRKTKTFVGSPFYMPPEQFLGEGLGEWSDLYSVGVLLYESLTGSRPYKGKTARDIFEDIKSRPVESPRAANPELNQCLPVVRVVMKALERKPESRYRSARDFFNELNSAFDEWKDKVVGRSDGQKAGAPRRRPSVAAGAARSSASAPAPAPAPRRPRRRTSSASGGVALLTWGSVLAVGVAIALFLFSNDRNQPPQLAERVEPIAKVPDAGTIKDRMFEKKVRTFKRNQPEVKERSQEEMSRQARTLFEELLAQWKSGTLEKSDLAAMRDKFRDIRLLDAEYSPPYELLGHVEIKLEMWDDAYQSYLTALSLYSSDGTTEISPELYKNLALTRVRGALTDPEEAKLFFRKALELDPTQEEILVGLVNILEKENLDPPTELLDLLESAPGNGIENPRIDELHEKYFVTLPRAERERMEKLQREIDEAFKAGDFERVVDKGIELFTEDPSTDLGLRIAFAYRERWEFQKGLDMLHTVMSKLAKGESERTKDFEFLGNIALDYARIHLASYESGDRDSRGEIDDALMNLTTAVHLARELGKKDSSLLVHALSYRARCYLHLGDRDGLRRDLKDVQASGVKDGFLLFHQGETLYMLGKTTLDRGLKKTYYGQAVSRLDKAGRQLDSRKDALLAQQVYSRLGLVYYELGDRSNLNASNASFKKAAKAGLETPALYMSWGRTFVKLDKKREAAQKFRESYKLEPSIDACHEAAYWFYTSKVRQSAIGILDQGLARFPKSQKLRDLKQIVSRDD